MSSVGLFAVGPLEVLYAQGRGMFRPVFQVSGRVEQPVLHHITRLIAGGIVSGKEPEGVVFYQYSGVGGVLVADYWVTRALELVRQHITPFLLQASQFVGSHRYHRAVTGKEVLTERLRLLGECLQIL